MAGADPSRVFVRVGRPIPVSPGARAAELASQARAEVQRLVDDARRAAQPPPTK
jgi:hypothetical protein